MIFDGKKIRDEIIGDLESRILNLAKKPTLAVIWVGEDEVTGRYVEIKQQIAEKIGVNFDLIRFPADEDESLIIAKIEELNGDAEVDGIMVQIPLPKSINQHKIIEAISPKKDVDGLRYCSNLACDFSPPVVGAIVMAMTLASKQIFSKKFAIVGKGFLVGSPLIRYLNAKKVKIEVIDHQTNNMQAITKKSDVIISAVGKPHLISAEMVLNNAILIDAGTSESNGALAGDIDPAAYSKASFYTPTPGGIGPVTVAMLFKNLVTAAERKG